MADIPLKDTKETSKSEKIQLVQNELDATKSKMQGNIGKLLERGEKIESLEDKAVQLSDDAAIFRKSAKKMRCHFMIQYWKTISLIIIIILILYFSLRDDSS